LVKTSSVFHRNLDKQAISSEILARISSEIRAREVRERKRLC
jgi:hypothetical protein